MALADVKQWQTVGADANTLAILPMQEASATTAWDNYEGDANWDATPASGNEPQVETSTLPNANYTRARIFDNNDYAYITDPSELPTGDVTFELFYYSDPDTVLDTESLMAIYKATDSNRSFVISRTNAATSAGGKYITFQVTADGVNWKYLTTGSALTDSSWNYIACVFVAGTSMKIYVNGSEAASSTTSIPASMKNSAENIYIGRYNSTWGGNNALEGLMVDIRISNKARTATEISAHWAGTDGSAPATSNTPPPQIITWGIAFFLIMSAWMTI